MVRYPRAVHADIVDHGRGPGFLTVVAATAVLGSQLSVYHVLPGTVLVAFVAWMLALFGVLRDVMRSVEGR
ncbi:hypothetical protein [Paraburkholderia sp. CNPSo 3076]|uniref:hypothetical protein n=1 Tax=Paraburkholderia sp. CNPSo 3076 TaxID=2940936 RepID=UPI00224D6FED|nr:hypothetical protein [Paraburkholderia sp. CNPSo 3076]